MVQHWKCCVRKRTAGSNPVLSANKKRWVFTHLFFCCLDGIRTNLRKQAIYIILIFGVEAPLQQKKRPGVFQNIYPVLSANKKRWVFTHLFLLLGDVDLNLFRFAIRVLAPVILAVGSHLWDTAIPCPLRQQKRWVFTHLFSLFGRDSNKLA